MVFVALVTVISFPLYVASGIIHGTPGVGVIEGVTELVGVTVIVGVTVGVNEIVGVAVGVIEFEIVAVGVIETEVVAAGVDVGVMVGVTDGVAIPALAGPKNILKYVLSFIAVLRYIS